MYISQLVINGFKTFSSKTTLEFGDGITAVVGPNGCGKTNIVDAIRWVLGEQKYSTLRSARMEDVIFNGAKGIKPTSLCEVYLTVKNDRGKLPIEYNDVEIGRRLYRNGESDYFLNRTTCRLKDINNLFVDTGMGADSYSVIELKMIEQILSEADDDRKFLFEEAAGINKYKTQRRLSIKKFEATKFDLERINDIIIEVDGKVKGLNLQLKRFKRHATLVEKLKECEITLSALQINKYLQISEPLGKKIDEFSHLRRAKVSNQDLNEAEIAKLRNIYSEQGEEINLVREESNRLDGHREEARQNILIWQEQNKSADINQQRLNTESASNKSRIEKYHVSVSDILNEYNAKLPLIDEKLLLYKSEQTKFEKLEKTYLNEQKIVDEIQTNRWEMQKEMSDNRSLAVSTESTIKERIAQKDRISNKIVVDEELVEKLELEKKSFGENYQNAEKKLKSLIDNRNNVEKSIEQHNLKLDANIAEQQSLSVKMESLTNQLNFYEELLVSQSDLPGGLKFALDKKIESNSVIGTVADLFSTDEKYELAISTALGEFAHSLICTNRESAINILRAVRSNSAGKISIIPIAEMTANNKQISKVSNNQYVIECASSLIKTKDELKPLAETLLGNILIVNDLAKAMLDNQLKDWILVDIDGASWSNNLVLKNPSAGKGTPIGRKDKIESIKSVISGIKNDLNLIDKDTAKISDQKKSDIDKSNSLKNQIETEKKSFEILNANYQRAIFEIENKQNIVSESKKELIELKRSIEDLKKSIVLINSKVSKSEKNISSIQNKLNEANDKLLESRKNRDLHHQSVQDLRIELLNLENNRDNLSLQKKTAESTVIEIEERQKIIANDLIAIDEQSKERAKLIKEKEIYLVEVNAKLKKSHSILELKEQTYRDTYRSIEEIENKIKSEQKSRESILEELKQCEIAFAEYKQKINSIKDRISEKYDEDVPQYPSIDADEEELEQEIFKLERSIGIIGPVNMAVQTEYEDEQKRLEHLIGQRDDLVKAEENLRESIEKIDRIARKQFRETFEQIKTNFENLFTVFFEGGQGTLDLIGNPDPLEAEIAIKAQPPGKRNQTLRMLSAGEKSLTAIALLFAIYQYKPSPYCILDEVDAPLDDTNVRKFTRALRSFTKDTQFIVVTHNKLTMEAADYLYGVTMEKKGISKLVSVKFD